MELREILAELLPRSRNFLWVELERRGVDIADDASQVFSRMTEGDILMIPKMGQKCLYDIVRVLKNRGIRLIPVNKPSKIAVHTRGNNEY